jgi:hypothetical protein
MYGIFEVWIGLYWLRIRSSVVGCSFSGTTFSVSDIIKLVNDLRVIYSQTNILYCLFSMLSFEVLFL